MTMTMRIYSKCCPHCKTGDLTLQEDSRPTLGKMHFIVCIQCGWEKDITDKMKEIRKGNVSSNRT